MFGQTFELQDILVVALLVVLEGVLSVDNALVLGLLAKPLPKKLQRKALTYGLVGAFVFRLIAVLTAAWLLHLRWIKLVGGAYLVYVALKHFLWDAHRAHRKRGVAARFAGDVPGEEDVPSADASPVMTTHTRRFWSAVVAIELTDIAFAVDSILAAVGMVRGEEKMWVVFTGGMLGVVLMRFAAAIFIRLLERFPRFEVSAYLLVFIIGAKLVLDWHFNRDPKHPRLDFHGPGELAFWVFWVSMVAVLLWGFVPKRRKATAA